MIETLKGLLLAVAALSMTVIVIAIAAVVVMLALGVWREFKKGRR